MTRDQVLTHIKDKNLKSKLYRSENLTLAVKAVKKPLEAVRSSKPVS